MEDEETETRQLRWELKEWRGKKEAERRKRNEGNKGRNLRDMFLFRIERKRERISCKVKSDTQNAEITALKLAL